jgi:hypothetical protein
LIWGKIENPSKPKKERCLMTPIIAETLIKKYLGAKYLGARS